MTSLLAKYAVSTPYGQTSIWDPNMNNPDLPAVLFIHDNSSCKEVWQKQLNSKIGREFRLIAMDLPGHGTSDSARSNLAEKVYSIPGYADVAIAVLNKLKIEKVVIVGWALGGHIAIDMLRYPQVQGIFINGTTTIPSNFEHFKAGSKLLAQESFSPEEARAFVALAGIDPKENEFLVKAAAKTDKRARPFLIASMQKGVGANQTEIIEKSDRPISIVFGSKDENIDYQYVHKQHKVVSGQKRVYTIEGGHATFWTNRIEFNSILFNFLADINQMPTLNLSEYDEKSPAKTEKKPSVQTDIKTDEKYPEEIPAAIAEKPPTPVLAAPAIIETSVIPKKAIDRRFAIGCVLVLAVAFVANAFFRWSANNKINGL